MNTHQFCFKPTSSRPGAVICIEVATEHSSESATLKALRSGILDWLTEKGLNPAFYLAPDLAYNWASSDRLQLAQALQNNGIIRLDFIQPTRQARIFRSTFNLLDPNLLGVPDGA